MNKIGLIVLFVATSLSCGGSTTFKHGYFQNDQTAFKVGALPGDWNRLEVGDDSALAWHSAQYEATVQINTSCDPEMDIPLEALGNHLLIGFTERQISEQRLVPMDKREALKMILLAKLDGVPRKMAIVILKKDGCVYDFTLVTPPDQHFSNALVHFESLLSGFHTEKRR